MPFLMGIAGPLAQSSQAKRLALLAQQYAQKDSLHSIALDTALMYAGFKHDEENCSDTIVPLADNQGIFVGKLFDRQNCLPATFTSADAEALIHDPKKLLRDWWGRYVGVLHNKTTHRYTLVRDPLGLSTVFYISRPDGIIFSSDLSMLYDVLEEKPSLDLNYFAEYIVGKNYTSPLMPFTGVRELQPGMGLHIQPDGSCSQKPLWDLSKCGGSFITDQNAFEEELLATLQSTLKAWVGQSSGVCLELSGGADSSGVMILLRNILPEHKNIIAVNFIDSKTPSSNEVEHAQEVADMSNAPLYFVDWQDSSLLDPLPSSWRPAKPSTFLLFHKTSQQLHELAQQYGCSEVMNGQGGDHVFLAPQPLNALADYWLDRGFKGIMHPMNELSSANRMSWLMLTRDTVKSISEYYRGKEVSSPEDISYLESTFHHVQQQEAYHLKESVKTFYPAKKAHVKSLFHAVAFADRNQRMPYRTLTHPLLSQPLVELGLKIPTYQSFNNGFDRIFFRNSVSRIKKPQALWRTMKGETTGSMAKSFAQHASAVHDIILQGRLAQDGLVNKQWLDREMAKIRHGQIENLWPIIHLLTSQLWMSQWKM